MESALDNCVEEVASRTLKMILIAIGLEQHSLSREERKQKEVETHDETIGTYEYPEMMRIQHCGN